MIFNYVNKILRNVYMIIIGRGWSRSHSYRLDLPLPLYRNRYNGEDTPTGIETINGIPLISAILMTLATAITHIPHFKLKSKTLYR